MQPHMRQQIEAQHMSWGQVVPPLLLSTPFYSGVTPLLLRMSLTLICTPILNLMGMIWSESMISQAFQTCYSLTKIIPYTLKRIAFTTSRTSEMKARAKEAPPINLYSKKYIRILQMLETQLKKNRKGNPLFYYFLSHLSSMALLCSHDSRHLPVLHISQTWPYNPALPLYFTPTYCFPNPKLAFFYSKYGLETHDSVSEYQQYDCCPVACPFLDWV